MEPGQRKSSVFGSKTSAKENTCKICICNDFLLNKTLKVNLHIFQFVFVRSFLYFGVHLYLKIQEKVLFWDQNGIQNMPVPL